MIKKDNKSKSWKIPLFIIVGILLLIILLLVFPISNSSGNVIKDFQGDEMIEPLKEDNLIEPNKYVEKCYNEKVPYETQEEYLKTEYYTETIPYEKEIDLEYESDFEILNTYDDGLLYGCGSLFDYAVCFRFIIYNKDYLGGTFGVDCEMVTLYDDFYYDSGEIYIQPGEVETILCEANVDLGTDVKLENFKITPPTKTELAYKEVQRERQVTAYRPVTKYRTEEVCN